MRDLEALEALEELARQALGPKARVVVTVALGVAPRCTVVAGIAFDTVHVEAATFGEAHQAATVRLRELAKVRSGDASRWGDR